MPRREVFFGRLLRRGLWRRTLLPVAGAAMAAAGVLAALWVGLWSFYNPPLQVPAPEVARFPSVAGDSSGRALFLGDFAPGDAALSRIEKYGYGYQFYQTKGLLHTYDVVVANLESPVTTSDAPWVLPSRWVYKANPDLVPAMREAGMDVVTLANNHVYDYGASGLADTIRHLDAGGIRHLGAGLSEARARRGLVLNTSGGRIGLLAYAEDKPRWRLRNHAFALDTPFYSWPGAARLNLEDVSTDIARMRAKSHVVVVSIHWGENYQPVNDRQRALGRACIDAGADVVIGHHPHQYHPVGLYRGRPIIYSLGNYAFGTRGRSSMRFGMGAALHIRQQKLWAVEFIPLLTQNRMVAFQPRIPQGRHLRQFFRAFQKGSSYQGARIQRRDNRGWLLVGF